MRLVSDPLGACQSAILDRHRPDENDLVDDLGGSIEGGQIDVDLLRETYRVEVPSGLVQRLLDHRVGGVELQQQWSSRRLVEEGGFDRAQDDGARLTVASCIGWCLSSGVKVS